MIVFLYNPVFRHRVFQFEGIFVDYDNGCHEVYFSHIN